MKPYFYIILSLKGVLNNIKDNLFNETNNICLVSDSISYEYGKNVQENYIRDPILKLRQYYKVTLIYSYALGIFKALAFFKHLVRVSICCFSLMKMF